eukprot:2107796-Rhodomonas_salina.1
MSPVMRSAAPVMWRASDAERPWERSGDEEHPWERSASLLSASLATWPMSPVMQSASLSSSQGDVLQCLHTMAVSGHNGVQDLWFTALGAKVLAQSRILLR